MNKYIFLSVFIVSNIAAADAEKKIVVAQDMQKKEEVAQETVDSSGDATLYVVPAASVLKLSESIKRIDPSPLCTLIASKQLKKRDIRFLANFAVTRMIDHRLLDEDEVRESYDPDAWLDAHILKDILVLSSVAKDQHVANTKAYLSMVFDLQTALYTYRPPQVHVELNQQSRCTIL